MHKKSVYTLSEMCTLFNKGRNSILNMLEKGELPECLPREDKAGAPRLWRKSEIDDFLGIGDPKQGTFTTQQRREMKLIMKEALLEVLSEAPL